MCSLCGAVGEGPAWEQEGLSGSETRWRLRREAAATAAELTRLFSEQRIKVAASPEFGFLVEFPTGGTEITASLRQVWHLLERRKVAIPDPLER
jgi:hypothetical protein